MIEFPWQVIAALRASMMADISEDEHHHVGLQFSNCAFSVEPINKAVLNALLPNTLIKCTVNPLHFVDFWLRYICHTLSSIQGKSIHIHCMFVRV